MTSASIDSSDLHSHAVRYYRFFLSCHSLQRDVERLSEEVISLDRLLLNTLSPVFLPLQQQRMGEALYEAVSYARVRRAMTGQQGRSERLYGAQKQRAHANNSNNCSSAAEYIKHIISNSKVDEGDHTLASTSPAALSQMPASEDDPNAKTHSACASLSPTDSRATYQSSRPPPPAPRHAQGCALCSLREAPSPGKRGKSRVANRRSNYDNDDDGGADAEATFTKGYGDDPYTSDEVQTLTLEALRNCPRCFSQVHLQSVWHTLRLLQRLHIVSICHGAAAPRLLPRRVLNVSPLEGMVHAHYAAQRFAQTAMQMSLMFVDEQTLSERLKGVAIDMPLLGRMLLRDVICPSSKKITKMSLPTVVYSGGQYDCDAAASPANAAMQPRSEEAYRAALQSTTHEICQSLLHASFAMLQVLPQLWPAMDLSATHPCHEDVESETHGGKTSKFFYTHSESIPIARAVMLHACVLAFTGGMEGVSQARRQLHSLAQLMTLMECRDDDNNDEHQHPTKKVSNHCIYRQAHAWLRNANVKKKKKPGVSSPPGAAEQEDKDACERAPDGRPLCEFEEMKQVVVLLSVFLDLVRQRDEVEVASTVQSNVATAAGSSIAEDSLPFSDQLHEQQEERRSRLHLAFRVLEDSVLTYLTALRNSVDGAASSRARPLLSLYWLLHGELERFLLRGECDSDEAAEKDGTAATYPAGSSSAQQQEGGKGVVPPYVQAAWQMAVKECDDAREFVGLTMSTVAEREGARATPSAWRLRPPQSRFYPQNVDQRAAEALTSTASSHHKSSQHVVHVSLALLPMLWIRMWLVLCPSIFRGAASDLMHAAEGAEEIDQQAKEAEHVSTLSNPVDEAKKPKGKPKKSMKSGATGGDGGSKKQSAASKIGNNLMSPVKTAQQRHTDTVREAARSLKFSPQHFCFWWRWRCLAAEENTADFMSNHPIFAAGRDEGFGSATATPRGVGSRPHTSTAEAGARCNWSGGGVRALLALLYNGNVGHRSNTAATAGEGEEEGTATPAAGSPASPPPCRMTHCLQSYRTLFLTAQKGFDDLMMSCGALDYQASAPAPSACAAGVVGPHSAQFLFPLPSVSSGEDDARHLAERFAATQLPTASAAHPHRSHASVTSGACYSAQSPRRLRDVSASSPRERGEGGGSSHRIRSPDSTASSPRMAPPRLPSLAPASSPSASTTGSEAKHPAGTGSSSSPIAVSSPSSSSPRRAPRGVVVAARMHRRPISVVNEAKKPPL